MSRSAALCGRTRETFTAVAAWRKSTRSASDCVEVAFAPDAVGVRDSKEPSGSLLVFDQPAWTAFVHALRCGAFDHA